MSEKNISLQELGIKDLEHVIIKAKTRQDHGGIVFEAGEPILYFDNIQVAQLSEYVRQVAARGGWRNMSRVVWEDRDDVKFVFSNGTINLLSFNLLLESNMLIKNDKVYVPFSEIAEVDDKEENGMYGSVRLSHQLEERKKYFVKLVEYGNLQSKIEVLSVEEKNGITVLTLPSEAIGKIVVVDYYFNPKIDTTTYTLSQERVANLYTLEATFYMKDENTGDLRTGILEMPKVYIMSNIDLRMGERANPTVGQFEVVAMPEYDDYEDDAVLCRVSYIDADIYSL